MMIKSIKDGRSAQLDKKKYDESKRHLNMDALKGIVKNKIYEALKLPLYLSLLTILYLNTLWGSNVVNALVFVVVVIDVCVFEFIYGQFLIKHKLTWSILKAKIKLRRKKTFRRQKTMKPSYGCIEHDTGIDIAVDKSRGKDKFTMLLKSKNDINDTRLKFLRKVSGKAHEL